MRKSPPSLRCQVPVAEVDTFFKVKYQAPPERTEAGVPPFPLWDHPQRSRPLARPQVLGVLNTCRINGKIPPEWKTSTTILIHKGDDPLILDNWRPLALQNTLYKVYAAVIAKRITDWAMEEGIMSSSQNGFLPMEGCLEHNHIMTSVLQDSRRRKQPIILTWLDLKDAGSVPHQTLFTIMGVAGLGGLTLQIVRDLYHQTTTAIRTMKDRTRPITIQRGVKQGCPLSPILFNLVMEVLIRAAESMENAGYSKTTL